MFEDTGKRVGNHQLCLNNIRTIIFCYLIQLLYNPTNLSHVCETWFGVYFCFAILVFSNVLLFVLSKLKFRRFQLDAKLNR